MMRTRERELPTYIRIGIPTAAKSVRRICGERSVAEICGEVMYRAMQGAIMLIGCGAAHLVILGVDRLFQII